MAALLALLVGLVAALPSGGAFAPLNDGGAPPGSWVLDQDVPGDALFPFAPDSDPEEIACAGVAPETTWCTTGLHHRAENSMVHGFLIQPGYTGTLESRLWSSLGLHVFRCTLADPGSAQCEDWGPWPPFFSTFTHDCSSYEPGTSTPGGVGAWVCFVHSCFDPATVPCWL